MPKAKKSPNKSLDKILQLIDQDIKLITKTFKGVLLDKDTAQTLCRFATTLHSIQESKETEIEKEKKVMSKLSTDELIKLYNETNTDNKKT